MTLLTPVSDRSGIFDRVKESKGKLASLGVVRLGLFGSFARGEQTESSDVDILVEFSPEGYTFDNFMEVSFFLKTILGRKVEVVTPDSISPHIQPGILKETVQIDVAA